MHPSASPAESDGITDSGAGPTLTKGKTVLLVAALVSAVVSFQLNASMLVPAIGAINEKLGDGAFTAMGNYFFLAGAIVSVIFARWSDFVGRKPVLIGIMGVAVVGTIVCIVATSLPVMVAGRILQGGCVISFSLAYMILREHLSGPMFGACVGVISAINGGVAGLDTLLGGAMVDAWGYQSIFVLIAVVGVAAIVFALIAVPGGKPKAGAVGKMDWLGGVVLAAAVASVNLYLTTGGTSGWLSGAALAWICAAVISLVVFVVVESKVASPLISVRHMRSLQVWPVLTSITLALSAFYVVLNFIVPAIAENKTVGWGLDGTEMALLFLTPAALLGLASAPIAGRIAVKTHFVTTLRVGIMLTLVVTAATAFFALDKWIVFALMMVFGVVYNGLLLTSASGMGVVQAPDDAPGSLPGIANACFGIGASIGFAWSGPIVSAGTASGYHNALWLCVAIGVVALASSFILRPKPAVATTSKDA